MNITGLLNRWGKGQLFAYSGLEGKTDYDNGLVLRSCEEAAFDIHFPGKGRIAFEAKNTACRFLCSDGFELDGVRGAMPDCHHLLIAGEAAVDLQCDTLKMQRKGDRLLIGYAAKFNPELLDADLDALLEKSRAYFAPLPDFGVTDPLRRAALAKAYSQLKSQVNSPSGAIPYLWTTPDRWPHRDMWLWDTVFHAVGLRFVNSDAARESMRAVFSQQLPDGLIPHMMSPHRHSAITQPPILALGVALQEAAAPDRNFLEESFPALERYVEWIFQNRDSDGQGLVEWDIEGNPFCRSGESGMDNSSRFDAATELDAPDFNSYLSLECELLAEFAEQLGMPGRSAFWRERHERLNDLINRLLWNEEEGIYMDRDVNTGKFTGIASSAGFLPLICGAPSPEQAAKLLANLKNPTRFGTPNRVPSISCDNPAAYSKDMWRGPVWININWLICRGLDRCGYADEARLLRKETVEMEEAVFGRCGTFFEFYDDRAECDPPALLRKGKCAPEVSPYHQSFYDYGWSGTLFIDMVRNLAGEKA